MTRLIALAGLAAYVCQTPIERNGAQLAIGEPIELQTADAQALLDVGAIAHADGNATQALQTGTDGLDALLEDLQNRDAALAQARLEIAALQGDKAEMQRALADQAKVHDAEARRQQLAAENANSRDLQAQLDAAQADLAGAAAKVIDLEAANAQLRGQATTASEQLDDLQAQLAKATAAKPKR